MPLKETQTSVIEWLSKYWFLIIALSAGSIAWGQTTLKVQTLEDAVKSNAETTSQVHKLQSSQERLDERTKAMIKAQETSDAIAKERYDAQQELLNRIIQNQIKGK